MTRVAVVGAGISGLAFARRLAARAPDATVDVFESEARVGGTATTDVVDGFVVDRGPTGFLTTMRDAVELARAVGLGDQLVAAAPASKRRFLLRGGRLRPVPRSLLAGDMLGLVGCARAAVEPWVGAPPPADDESVSSFVARRFGARASGLLAAPFVAGVTAGDAAATSVRALWPKLAEGEAEHGSVIRAMRATRRAQRAEPDGGDALSGLVSVRGGLGRLCEATAKDARARVYVSAPILSVDGAAGGWRVRRHGADGEERYDHVVFATPAHVTARLVSGAAPRLGSATAKIPYANIRVLTLGFERAAVGHDLDGFGFLAAPGEPAGMLGCVWASSTFPDRAPAGGVLLRVMIGGVHDPGAVDRTDEEVEEAALATLRPLLDLRGAPALAHHTRWREAIPQYTLGHLERVDACVTAARDAGVVVIGNAYEGISFNESIAAATRAADALAAAVLE
ncbi:MAG: protoporphyrinogen oxidase [Myxococcales bacterium]|nr:protoporphyrinogen oxidase [Myxococcales bacterium]